MSILQSFIAGQEARRQADAAAEVAKVQNFMAQYGQQIFQGDQNALGQLAGMGGQGLEMAMNLRNANDQRAAAQAAQAREGVVAGRQDQEWKWRLEEHAASLDAATREAERAKIAEGLAGAAYFHARGDQQGYEKFLAENDIDPAQFPFEQFPAHAARFKEVLDVYDKFKPEPEALPDSIVALQFRAREAGLQEGTPEYAAFMERGGTKPGPETSITVNSGGGSDKQVFDTMAASAESARSAVTGLRALQEAKAALDGGIISGAFADNILALQKIGASFGVVDPATIQNTETFRSAIAPQIAAMLKATVGSAQISNADREFAEKAAGGSITLDEGSIRRLVAIMEKGSRAAVESHIERLNAVYPETPEGTYNRERALFGISVPEPVTEVPGSGSPGTPPAPAGSTPSPQPAAPLPPDLQSIYDKYSTP